MEEAKPKSRLGTPANQRGIVNCCAALRRFLEKTVSNGDFSGAIQVTVSIQDGTIQSYRTATILPGL